jgi:TonB-linked SusC/RagA family outer membrane protein
MRRFLTLLTMLLLCSILAFAQSRVVSGKVTDESGNPVPFASVKVKGSKSGVSADAYGQYTIKVKDNDVLEISGTGFKAKEVNVGTQTAITTAIEKGASSTLTEVVVTGAFNVKRTARSTSANAQVVSGDQLNTIRTPDINNALAGKVAGVQVRSQSAVALGRPTAIRLRGENGFGAGGGALYVVDGTIIPNGSEINPDDVEDMTVLQGPAAAALFGPDGKNGAIVVTTKRAKKSQKNLGVEINSAVQLDRIYITPNYQNTYAGGGVRDLIQYNWRTTHPAEWRSLDGKYFHDFTDDASWGPRMVGQEYIPWYAFYPGTQYTGKTASLTPRPNNARDYYNTGVTFTNNINLSKAGDGYNLRFSYTNLDVKGLIPTEYMKRHTLNFNTSFDLNSHFTVGANINYIAQDRNSEQNDSYSNQSTGSFNQWFHRNLDMGIMKEMRNVRSPNGILSTWNHGNPGSYDPADPGAFYKGNYWFNFYSYFDNVSNKDRRDRIFGDVSLTYKVNNDLRVRFTYRKQQLTTNAESFQTNALEASGSQTSFNYYEGNNKASYGTNNTYSDRQNYEGMIAYNKKIKDFSISATGIFDILKQRTRSINANTVGGLNVEGLYSLANSKNPINYGNGRTNYARRSLIGMATFGYKNYLFVDGTFRRDYISTEPVGKPIDAKSIGAAFVFSDLIKEQVPFLSFGKIRASWGEVVDALNIYQLNSDYVLATQQFNNNFLMTTPDRLPTPTLSGSVNQEKEIGIELRFLKNRLGIMATYWNRVNKSFPVDASVNGASGISVLSLNAGQIDKEGIDITLNLKPFVKANFMWDINATWGLLKKNTITEIAPGLNRLVVASGAFSGSSSAYTVNEVGQRWGMMFGGGIKRLNGQPVLTDKGLFIREAEVKFGSVLPDYTGGIQNSFVIKKNFVVNINIDYSWGGKFFSLSDFWGSFSGLTARTAVLNNKGIPVRDPVGNGGGVNVTGVDATGKPVEYYVDAQAYFRQFRNANISEASVYDLTFVKMRELSIGYRIPVNRLGRVGKYVNNAVFSVISRNPWLIYSKTKDFDPSEISNVQGVKTDSFPEPVLSE